MKHLTCLKISNGRKSSLFSIAGSLKTISSQRFNSSRIVAAAIVERIPVVLPPHEQWEADYIQALYDRKKKSHLAHMEAIWKRFEEEMKLREKTGKQKTKVTKEKKEVDSDDFQVIDEKVDWKKLRDDPVVFQVHGMFTFAEENAKKEDSPIITEADKRNDRKSLYRALTDRLYLIVKKNRPEHFWQFPQGDYEEKHGNSLRKTAEKSLEKICGDDLSVWWTGHGPMAYWRYDLPSQYQKKYSATETKVFYFRSTFLDGKVNLSPDIKDYLWVTKSELKDYLDPDLFQYFFRVLI